MSFLALGYSPQWTLEEMPQMPKSRYNIMTALHAEGRRLGLDMMYRTCTVQVNLDFSSEADMVKKFRVVLALAAGRHGAVRQLAVPEGRPNGIFTYRSADLARHRQCAGRHAALRLRGRHGLSSGMSIMRSTCRCISSIAKGKYIDVAGESFRDFLDGRIPQLPGEKPTMTDWADHLTTIFPEVRLKRYLEMRGADSGPWRSICALPALWAGLLYDQASLDAAWDIVKDWTAEERQQLRNNVPRLALRTPFRGGTVLDVARSVLDISAAGLKARAYSNLFEDESSFLRPLREFVEREQTAADALLARYHGEWGGDVRPVFAENAY